MISLLIFHNNWNIIYDHCKFFPRLMVISFNILVCNCQLAQQNRQYGILTVLCTQVPGSSSYPVSELLPLKIPHWTIIAARHSYNTSLSYYWVRRWAVPQRWGRSGGQGPGWRTCRPGGASFSARQTIYVRSIKVILCIACYLANGYLLLHYSLNYCIFGNYMFSISKLNEDSKLH